MLIKDVPHQAPETRLTFLGSGQRRALIGSPKLFSKTIKSLHLLSLASTTKASETIC